MVRVRPPISTEVKLGHAVSATGGNISVRTDKSNVECHYDRVFPETTEQSQVFDCVQPLLQDVLKGINGTIFAYGQTSAGKSHTMLGPDGGSDILKTPRNKWGLLPRCAEYLLQTLSHQESEGTLSYTVKASFLQIYNETVYDLLKGSDLDRRFKEEEQAAAGTNSNKDMKSTTFYNDAGLKIREVARSGAAASDSAPSYGAKSLTTPQEVYVAGLSEYRVSTAEDVLHLVAAGTCNRAMRSTDFNATSSRSHAVLQLSLEVIKHGRGGETVISRSKLSLADLAGSEKILTDADAPSGADNTDNEYIKTRHLRELTSINTSLSCLGNVISALTDKGRTHVPYRDSKLTRLLQDSLGGNTRTILLACVAPTVMHSSETVSTLQFADRAKGVMLKVKANMVVDDKAALARANAEISRLQGLLANALAKLEGRTGGSPAKPNERMADSEAYVNGEGSGVDYYIKENARLREELFELRSMTNQPQINSNWTGNGRSRKKGASHKQSSKADMYSSNGGSSHYHNSEGIVAPGIVNSATAGGLPAAEADRTKERDLLRANHKQRRRRGKKSRQSDGTGNDYDEDDDQEGSFDNSKLVARFRQASKQDSSTLYSSAGTSKIYGSSATLKSLRKQQRNSFDASNDANDGLGETNRNYFSGFLSAMDKPSIMDASHGAKPEPEVNPYTGAPMGSKGGGKKKGNSNSARRSGPEKQALGGINGPNGSSTSQPILPHKASSTSPSRMRLQAERNDLEKAYKDAQSQLSAEMGMLDTLQAQRMSLERQLGEVGLNQSVDSSLADVVAAGSVTGDNDSTNAVASNTLLPHLDIADDATNAKDMSLSDDQYGSQDFQPLSLDGEGLGLAMRDVGQDRGFSPMRDGEENKENTGNASPPRQNSIAGIMSPKRKLKSRGGSGGGNGGVHSTSLRENVQQASAAQALPSPQKQHPSSLDSSSMDNALLNAPPPEQQKAPPSRLLAVTKESLSFTTADVGREMQQFSFRYNDWVNQSIDGYDPGTGFHKVTSMMDGTTQILDLRKKPVRLLA